MGDKIDQEPENDNAANLRINPAAVVQMCVEHLLQLNAMIANPETDEPTRRFAVWKVDSVYRAIAGVREESAAPYVQARYTFAEEVFRHAQGDKPLAAASWAVVANLITLFPSLGKHMSAERLEWIGAAISDERAKEGKGHAWASIARAWEGIEGRGQNWKNWRTAWEKQRDALQATLKSVSAGD